MSVIIYLTYSSRRQRSDVRDKLANNKKGQSNYLTSVFRPLKSDRLDHPLKGKEGEGQNTGSNQGDGGVQKRLGHPRQKNAFTNTGKQD